jgi:hypothetical protein
MNFIAASLLKVLNKEEESFWVFTTICEDYLPLDYYSDMLGILIDQKVFENLLTIKYPKLVAHFKTCSYALELISF